MNQAESPAPEIVPAMRWTNVLLPPINLRTYTQLGGYYRPGRRRNIR
jgi:hypothetical protein